jgi:alpha-1,2-mannosyltransferase
MTVAGNLRNRSAGGSPGAVLGGSPATRVYAVIAACTAAAVFLRFLQLSRPGYLLGITEYDDGVLFGNAVRLVNGVIPYRDFAVVQPPGSIVLMTPVALIAKVTGTDWGLGIARILTVGADCACVPLLGLLVRHRGALAAGVACGIYAVYPDALVASHTFLLEPWLNMFCLIGAWRVFDGDRVASGRRLAWGGLAFGFAATVKIWALVPLAVIAFLVLQQGGPRRLLMLAGGAVAGLSIAMLPFEILAPTGMVKDAIISQLVRSNGGSGTLLPRLTDMGGLSLFPSLPTATVRLVLLLVGVAVPVGYLLACSSARRLPAALDWYALVSAVAVLLLLLWPYGYYTHYGAFVGPFIALALALPVGLTRPGRRGNLIRILAVGTVAAAIIGGLGLRQLELEVHLQPWPSPVATADRLIPRGSCVLTNQAALTITADRFVPDTPGCPSMVDSYGTLIAMTGGHQMAAKRQVLATVTAVWRSAFAHATYVWIDGPTQEVIPWTRGLHNYLVSHFRLIGFAGIHPGSPRIPREGLYVRRR